MPSGTVLLFLRGFVLFRFDVICFVLLTTAGAPELASFFKRDAPSSAHIVKADISACHGASLLQDAILCESSQ